MITPDKLAKSGTEHGHQAALFAYCAVAYYHGWAIADKWAEIGPNAFKESSYNAGAAPAIPALEWFHAIHNQGHGDKIRGGKAKAEGVRKGVSDTFLPWPLWERYPTARAGHSMGAMKYAGLYIEMKKPSEKPKREGSKGGVSEEQAKFGEYAKKVGYGFAVCYGWREAVEVLRSYIEY